MLHRAALLSVLTLFAMLLGATSALAAEHLTPSPDHLEFQFDKHFPGNPQHQSVSFSNETASAVTVSSVEITGSSSFQKSNDECMGTTLEPEGKCSIEVEFNPASGQQSASLELLDEGKASVASVPLSSLGITGTLTASPNPLSFSPIPYTPPGHEGEYQESEPLNIQDSLDASTQIESATITGPDASSFSIAWGSNCEHELLHSDTSCGMGIRFAATSPGPKSASLIFNSDSSATPLVVPLAGEALHGPQISVASTQALLGDVPIGSSAQHTFTLTNTGDYPLFIQQDFLISGTPLMFPIVSDTCGGQAVPPGSSCELTVGFEPTTLGEKGASIILITNASPIHVLGIDGVAVPPLVMGQAGSTSPIASSAVGQPPLLAAAAASFGGVASQPILAVIKAPRLHTSAHRAALDTGFVAQCPAQLASCETVSVTTASIRAAHSRAPERGVKPTTVVLGSALIPLHGGQSTPVRIALSGHAIALLRQRGRLRVTIEAMIRADGRIVAKRTRVVKLAAPRAVARSH
jgi:hypothetical protein